MDFPVYVPVAVRGYVTSLLKGNAYGAVGWEEAMSRIQQRLDHLDCVITNCIQQGLNNDLVALRRERVAVETERNMLAEDTACIQRLIHDQRMESTFAILNRAALNDVQWHSFFDAAWSAHMAFKRYREQLKKAMALKAEIAEAADKLAVLIGSFHALGLNGPEVFFSIPALLRETDNHKGSGQKQYLWRFARKNILGDCPESNCEFSPSFELDLNAANEDIQAEVDPVEQGKNAVHIAWRAAPDFSALLGTVAHAARDYKPCEAGMIGAAIESRKQNPKIEYLRAFWHLLEHEHGFLRAKPIVKAITVVANVVINSPDVDVTYDDARKVTLKPKPKKLEDSPP